MRVFLVGFMGSGKSRTGRELASLLGVPFIDLDTYVQEHARMTIADIFERHSEAYFRELERDLLEQLVELPSFVMATGGGTPCYHDNIDLMSERGTTVFLDVPEEVLFGRLQDEREKRPLLRDRADLLAFISAKLGERMEWYGRATVKQRATHPPRDVARRIAQRLAALSVS